MPWQQPAAMDVCTQSSPLALGALGCGTFAGSDDSSLFDAADGDFGDSHGASA